MPPGLTAQQWVDSPDGYAKAVSQGLLSHRAFKAANLSDLSFRQLSRTDTFSLRDTLRVFSPSVSASTRSDTLHNGTMLCTM